MIFKSIKYRLFLGVSVVSGPVSELSIRHQLISRSPTQVLLNFLPCMGRVGIIAAFIYADIFEAFLILL